MTLVSKPENIWVLKLTDKDIAEGAKYAAISLPWTFNRMMMNTSSYGQQSRALNIAKGIVVQEALRRALSNRGIVPKVQRKSQRDEDLFDFCLHFGGRLSKLDVKSISYYNNYADVGREPLTPELIIANAGYAGADWRRFFPMLVPHTQIKQEKEGYCFCITSSIDTRRDIDTKRIGYALTAFPYGESLVFLSSQKLCLSREGVSKGFYIECSYRSQALLNNGELHLTVIGEWAGTLKKLNVRIKRNSTATTIGPFSCVSCFQIGREEYDKLYGQVNITVCRNEFEDPVYNTARRNINIEPSNSLALVREDFCNLMLPVDYTVYAIGWVTKEEFIQKCRNYTGWVWPLDKINKFKNQPWSQITANDVQTISRAGFADCIQKNPPSVRVGCMKTTGRGAGACCYVFPNVFGHGGLKETNLYVLPQDLHIMDELGA